MPRTRRLIFDDLVGAREDRWRHGQPERLGGLEIDHQFEMSRLLERQIGGFGPPEDFVDQRRGALKIVSDDGAIGEKAARLGVAAQRIDRRQPETGGEPDNAPTLLEG